MAGSLEQRIGNLEKLYSAGSGSLAEGIPLGIVVAPANRHDSPLLGESLDALEALGNCLIGRTSTSTAPTTPRPPEIA